MCIRWPLTADMRFASKVRTYFSGKRQVLRAVTPTYTHVLIDFNGNGGRAVIVHNLSMPGVDTEYVVAPTSPAR